MSRKNHSESYVFISYKREEVETASRLKIALENKGFTIWWDEDIQCGQVWSNILDEAVKKAHCIVVLWSQKSLLSRWVMHEASSAMDRGIYAPARIELVAINAPYDRYQASDLLEWDGSNDHPGFIDLQSRILQLIPKPVSWTRRIGQKIWDSKFAVISAMLAIIAFGLLFYLYLSSENQISELNDVVTKLDSLDKKQQKGTTIINENINDVIKMSEESSILLDKVKSDLSEAEDQIVKNLELQENTLVKADRILTPLSNIDFILTLSYDFDDTLFIKYLDTLKSFAEHLRSFESITTYVGEHPFPQTLYITGPYPLDSKISLADSIYFIENSLFKFRNNKISRIEVLNDSKLMPINLTDPSYVLGKVDLRIGFSKQDKEYNVLWDESMIVSLTDRKITSNFLQNRTYSNTSEHCRVKLLIDFEKHIIKKTIVQPFVNIRHKGRSIVSYKDLAGLDLYLYDQVCNDAIDSEVRFGHNRIPPEPIEVENIFITINGSEVIFYDKTYPLYNPNNPNPIEKISENIFD